MFIKIMLFLGCFLVLVLVVSNSFGGGVVILPDYSFKYSATTQASKGQVWEIWSDVEHWTQFDERLEYSYLEEGNKFESGARGYLKGRNAPRTAFELMNVKPEISFTQRLELPFYQTIELQRYFEESSDGQTTFTHEVNFKGRLKPLTYMLLCGPFKRDLKLVIDSIKEISDQQVLSDD